MFRKLVLALSLVALLAFSFAFVSPASAAPKASDNTIAAIASSNPNFTTLVAALQAAGLVDVFNGKGQYTVFAPTNDAFAKLGLNASNVGSLPKDQLTNILMYHVARGSRSSGDVVSSSQIRMLNGEFTKISLMNGAAYIDSSKIIATDIPASNGVIHVIDTVLMP